MRVTWCGDWQEAISPWGAGSRALSLLGSRASRKDLCRPLSPSPGVSSLASDPLWMPSSFCSRKIDVPRGRECKSSKRMTCGPCDQWLMTSHDFQHEKGKQWPVQGPPVASSGTGHACPGNEEKVLRGCLFLELVSELPSEGLGSRRGKARPGAAGRPRGAQGPADRAR